MAKTLIGNIKGPKGDPGPKGATGAVGAQGPAGAPGNTGATGQRGSRWTEGTAITGTSTTATVFSGSGITDALVNDMYMNTSTGNVYRCTTAGNASAAKWVHVGNIKGPKGEPGAKGDAGDKGDKGDKGEKGEKGDTPTNGTNMTSTFTQATSRANIESGEKHGVLFGKVKKWFADLTAAAFAQMISSYSDLMANTVSGYLPDALAVKAGFNEINSNLQEHNNIKYVTWLGIPTGSTSASKKMTELGMSNTATILTVQCSNGLNSVTLVSNFAVDSDVLYVHFASAIEVSDANLRIVYVEP